MRLRLMLVAALFLSALPAATLTTRPVQALSRCDWAQFVADVTIPDGTKLSAGQNFTKTWRIRNIGTCTWTTSYTLVFSSGSQMGGASPSSLPNTVAPGQTVDVTLSLTAPGTPGNYRGYWLFKNSSGTSFGIGSAGDKSWWVDINVTGGSTPPAAAYDFAANVCSAGWYSSQGSLPCSGNDGDPAGFVIKVGQPTLESGATDPGVALLTNPQNVFNGDIHGTYPPFHVEAGDRFQANIACSQAATNCDVTFRLDYQVAGDTIGTLWSARERYDGLVARADADLSSLAGQDVRFILTVLATDSANGDRAMWVNPVITRSGSTVPTPGARKFDFGTATSPVASGYVRVTESTAYVAGAYGWTTASNAQSLDRRSQADPLKRDFVMSGTAAPTFRVDLPNGNYAVTVTQGDNDAVHDNMVVKANGRVVLPDVDTAAGAFSVQTFTVAVTSASLTFQFLDAGGTDSLWVVNGISIAPSSQPPSACDRAQFVSDVTVRDGTTFAPGALFTKTWRLKNIGSCTWTTSYALVFDTGEKMAGPDLVNLPQNVPPGQMVDITVNLTAPSTAGSYRGYWKFQNADGVRFGLGTDASKSWWVDIKVSGSVVNPAGCDRAQFVSDVTIPDGSTYAPGAFITKTWRLKNIGTCTWNRSYSMVFSSGERMSAPSVVSVPRDVAPGTTVDMTVSLIAPSSAASYRGYWMFQNPNGVRFGLGADGSKSWWIDIKVSGSPVTPVPGLTVRGHVHRADGSPLSGVAIYRSFAVYSGEIVATTDASGYFETGFAFIPGDEQVRVWPSAPGYTFDPESVYWRHYHGVENLTFDFTAYLGGSPTPTAFITTTPAVGPTVTETPIATGTPVLTDTPTPFPTFTPTPTATSSGGNTSDWILYQNTAYGFSFRYPPGSTLDSQADNGGRIYLPVAPGTNLVKKVLDLSVVEGVSPCKSPQTNPTVHSEAVNFNGIQFLKETWLEAITSHLIAYTAYSTAKGNACISFTFWLWSVVPEVMETPPPRYDPVVESAVFSAILSTYTNP